ncbi:glycosyltransferase family 4 protein [Serratia marcescens]|uniref:glycosyltransferase family 4 protein n=1 Tax=Serratia marcescens TaxID=615 RepID=UPI001EFF1FB7|nr:glycosyltransferase family 4 protein [Serratia marcescens]
MKIMMINTLYHPYKIGGAEVSVQLLAEKLANIGHIVKVITLHNKRDREQKTINNVMVTYLPLKNVYWPYNGDNASPLKKIIWHARDQYNITMKRAVKEEIKDFHPDVVHTNNLGGFSISAWDAVKECKVKLVHTARDYYLFHPNSTLFKNGKVMNPSEISVKFFSFFKKWKSKAVSDFVGISRYISELHIKNGFFDGNRSSFIYNPIEPLRFEDKKSSTLRVGFIGRLTTDKGFDEYCLLADKYKNRSDVKFYAAGRFNGNEADSMKALAEKSNVELLGFIAIEEFMANVDAVILPTKWNEPFGRSVAECALSGKVVYTNFMGGISEIATMNSNVKPLSSFRVEDAHANKENNAQDSFDIDYIVKQYVEVYNK